MQKHHRGERRFQTERLKKKRQFYWGYSPDLVEDLNINVMTLLVDEQ